MPPLPLLPSDPTLDAADAALEALENGRPPRDYLGMSGIAHPCNRKNWYDWRWVTKAKFNAETLKRFADGHAGEEVQATRLRMVPGLTLITLDPDTGRQIACSDHGGHFKGHADGMILGLLQSPKTWTIWEHKQVSEKKQNELIKFKNDLGEKNALQRWNEIYYGQACLYMNYTGITRHYLTCSTPGGRSTISCRTEQDTANALRLIAKGRNIIESPVPPGRMTSDRNWYMCKWCDHFSSCWDGVLPERHCRSCLSASPVQDGKWKCERFGWELSSKAQRIGCEQHRYIPALVAGEQVDAGPNAEFIDYILADGTTWRDGPQ